MCFTINFRDLCLTYNRLLVMFVINYLRSLYLYINKVFFIHCPTLILTLNVAAFIAWWELFILCKWFSIIRSVSCIVGNTDYILFKWTDNFDAVLCFEVHVAQSVIFRVVHCGPLVVLSTFISFNHCVLYHSSIQYIWFLLWYVQTNFCLT